MIAKDVKKAFGDRLLIENLTFALPRGGIVGIIGPNGAGKTTLFRMIMGEEKPDTGTQDRRHGAARLRRPVARRSTTTRTLGGDQRRQRRLIMVGKKEINSRAYVSSFNFHGADQQKKVGNLSGGERNRVHLAKTLIEGGNLLLLDEPTNDLDVDTLRALEDALLEFAGCAVVITHDRWFLDRIATHILAFEGDSEARLVRGELRRLHRGPQEAERSRRRPAAPHQVQAADAHVALTPARHTPPSVRARSTARGPGSPSAGR